MTEVEKLDAGLPYDFWDPEVNARKMNVIEGCKRLNACDPADDAAVFKVPKSFFGSVGEHASVLPGFICDNGKNIHVGQDVPDNTLVGGVPAKVIRTLENDIPEDVPEDRSEDSPRDSSENMSEDE